MVQKPNGQPSPAKTGSPPPSLQKEASTWHSLFSDLRKVSAKAASDGKRGKVESEAVPAERRRRPW
eukprot:scaffold1638_cov258-Pinguiococcus_pyrenoidosus.AAC.93